MAAAGAKLEVLRIINEPTAAALAYGHGPSTERERLGENMLQVGACIKMCVCVCLFYAL